jgi:hypothetical protein
MYQVVRVSAGGETQYDPNEYEVEQDAIDRAELIKAGFGEVGQRAVVIETLYTAAYEQPEE